MAAGLSTLGRSHVDADGATVNLDTVHHLLGPGGKLSGAEGDEAEATAATAVAVDDNLSLDDIAGALVEGLVQRGIRGAPGQVAHEKTGAFVSSRHSEWVG